MGAHLSEMEYMYTLLEVSACYFLVFNHLSKTGLRKHEGHKQKAAVLRFLSEEFIEKLA